MVHFLLSVNHLFFRTGVYIFQDKINEKVSLF